MIDQSAQGRDLGQTRFPVERSKLRELALAFGDDDPVWYDEAAARAAGFDAIPVPPTVTVLADHWRPNGALEHPITLGADLERLLHGEATWDYVCPIRVGEELTAVSHVGEVSTREGKRGGSMTMVTVVTSYTDAAGLLVALRSDTLIETGAAR